MKRIGLLLFIVLLVVVGIFVSQSDGDESGTAKGKEVATPPPSSEPPAKESVQVDLKGFRPSAALPPASALFVRIDVRKPFEKTPVGDLQDLVTGRQFETTLDDFLRNVPPPLAELFVESGRLFQKPVCVALLDRPRKENKGPLPWTLCGEIGDATRSVTKFLEKYLAPIVAGPKAPEVKEDFKGVTLMGRGGPEGGLFWLFSQGEFLACPQKEILQELLGKFGEAKQPDLGGSGPVPACERIGYPTGEGSLSIFLDFKKAGAAGLLRPEPNPNLPIIVSGLAVAQRLGFEAVSLVYTPGERGGRVRFRLHSSQPLPPPWQTVNLSREFFDWVPGDASVAIGTALPEPVQQEGSPAVVESASSQIELAMERLLPDQASLVQKVFAKKGEPIIIGAAPVSGPDSVREYFAVVPFPGNDALALLLDWIKESEGNVETTEDAGITIHGIDFTGHPVLGESEISRLVIARMGERLVAGTHPAMILRFEPGTPFKTVSGTGAYQATADSLEDKAVFRAYLAAEFLARLLGAQIEESVDRFGLPDELRFLAWDVVVRLGPLFVSVSADQWDLSLDLVSPSDITPIASVFILHDLATAFLTEPRT